MQRPSLFFIIFCSVAFSSIPILGCGDSASSTSSQGAGEVTGASADSTSNSDAVGVSDTGVEGDTSGTTLNDTVSGASPDTNSTDVVEDTNAAEDTTPVDTTPEDTASDVPPEDLRPLFRECVARPFTPSFSGDWDHSISTPLRTLGSPGHSFEDLIISEESTSAVLEGKFAYGTLSLDLEDESVEAFIDDCGTWASLGMGVTDSDGRVRFDAPSSVLDQVGRYEVRMVVQGDGSATVGYLLVVPDETQFVVFDIDGTLTTGDGELLQEFFLDILGGTHTPEPYPGATEIVDAYRDAGYEIIFLTGRPYWLSEPTRAWLSLQNIPIGTLHLTQSNSQSLSTDSGVGTFKKEFLADVQNTPHTIFRTYGNATTDIYAYLGIGMDTAEVFIIGSNAGVDGTQSVSDYPAHLSTIIIPEAQQPFQR